MKEISIKALHENASRLISEDWMLISAGNKKDGFNTMTASWGGLGFIWQKDVAFIFVRPQRYTYQFVEANDTFSLCFFGKEYRKQLNFFGSVSGREHDKAKESGFEISEEMGTIYYEEAKIVIICKKLYNQDILESGFIDKEMADKFYKNDFHRMYIGGIEKVYINE